jgi:aerobic-type carbon monoxide dehydrogenase small subunit (CoxS/CutS family)/carbon monoxide dehydrogenase subunit G
MLDSSDGVSGIPIVLNVNGKRRELLVSPRDLLADVLRERLRLTGTHLGCEQGVCGACNIFVNGRPQRSCIALAIEHDGADIKTIEGFDADPLMEEMREAFSAKHALQCGFCTPGFLVTAHDIATRLGDIDEARIRAELAGNLCRCTGYLGIIDAVQTVCRGKVARPAARAINVGSVADISQIPAPRATKSELPNAVTAISQGENRHSQEYPNAIRQTIEVAISPDEAWKVLRDLRTAATCIPGAEITSMGERDLAGKMHIALGPIKAEFAGNGQYSIDESARVGRMSAGGTDRLTKSSANGEVEWTVVASPNGKTSIEVQLAWKLTGALAQFNRGGIVRETVRRLAVMFGSNLEQMLISGTLDPERTLKPISAGALLMSVAKAWFRGLFASRK